VPARRDPLHGPGTRVVSATHTVARTGGFFHKDLEGDIDRTRETIDVARAAGGEVVGTASIVDRSGGSIHFDVPFASLLQIALPTYEPEGCPLCAQGLPVVKPGSRVVPV